MTLKGQVFSARYVLPEPLASEYPGDVREVGYGGEADVFRVYRASGESFAVKLYRLGIRADRHIWDRLEKLRHGAVVRVEDQGTAEDGRDYEVLEYLDGGSLLDRLRTPMTEDQATLMARQLAGGLNCLHEAGIVHRDLKPANLLYRSGRADSDLVIADFGISRDPSMVVRTNSATVAYAPPEALWQGTVSAAHDWWSLGMIVRQAATGVTPFAGRSESEIMAMLETGTVQLDQVPSERLRRLCEGLLQKDPAHRWAGKQVLEWLDGRDVPVRKAKHATVRIPAPQTVVKGGTGKVDAPASGLEYCGTLHTTRVSLAAAIRKERNAAQSFFGDMGTREAPSERWRGLLEWLRAIDGLSVRERENRIELIDRWLHQDFSADVKLLRLLLWLDPNGAPVLRGDLLGPDRLAEMCAAAYREGGGAEGHLLRALDGPVVDALSEFPALYGMRQNWEASARGWMDAVQKSDLSQSASAAAVGSRDRLDVLLLLCSLPGSKAEEELGDLGDGYPPPERDSTWYGVLHRNCLSSGGPKGLGEAVRIHCGPEFASECEEKAIAAAVLARAEREEREVQARRELWRSDLEDVDREIRRLKGVWDAAERVRLGKITRLRFGLLAGVSYALCAAAIFFVPCEHFWGTPDVTPGTDRALLYETGILALPGLWSAVKRGWEGGSAYRPALFTLFHGKAATSSWWDGQDNPGLLWWGTMWSALYVLVVGFQWDAFLGHLRHDADNFFLLVDVVFLAVTGLAALVTAVLFTTLEKEVPMDPGFLRNKEEYERRIAELEASKKQLHPRHDSRFTSMALRSREGLSSLNRWFPDR